MVIKCSHFQCLQALKAWEKLVCSHFSYVCPKKIKIHSLITDIDVPAMKDCKNKKPMSGFSMMALVSPCSTCLYGFLNVSFSQSIVCI